MTEGIKSNAEIISDYLSRLDKLEFQKTKAGDKISEYITILLELLQTTFSHKKSANESLSGLEKNYKLNKGIKLLEDTTVQEFVNYWEAGKGYIRLVAGFGIIKIKIAIKLIEKIKQSIEN